MDVVTNTAKDIAAVYSADRLNWDAALGAVILMGVYALMHKHLSWNKWNYWEVIPRLRGKAMRRARRNYVRSSAVDGFVGIVEERVYQGEYTRDEAREIYRDLKKAFPIHDLYPSPALLKENIKQRLARKNNDPVPLPGKEKKPMLIRGVVTTIPAKA